MFWQKCSDWNYLPGNILVENLTTFKPKRNTKHLVSGTSVLKDLMKNMINHLEMYNSIPKIFGILQEYTISLRKSSKGDKGCGILVFGFCCIKHIWEVQLYHLIRHSVTLKVQSQVLGFLTVISLKWAEIGYVAIKY